MRIYKKLPILLIRIIGVVDTVALKLVLGDQAETLLSTSLALSVKPADGANFQETSFSIADPNTVQVCMLHVVFLAG